MFGLKFSYIFAAIFWLLVALLAVQSANAAVVRYTAKFSDVHREVTGFVRPGVFYSQTRNCAVRVEEQEAVGGIGDGLVRVTETLSAEPALVFTIMQLKPAKELAKVTYTASAAAEMVRTDLSGHQVLRLKGVGDVGAFEVSLLSRKNSRSLMRMSVKSGANFGYCY